MRKLFTLLLLAASLALGGCGYNMLQRQDEQVKAAWSEVLNQYHTEQCKLSFVSPG